MSQVGQRERLSAELDSPAAAKFRAPVMGVEVNECRIKRMRTLWGRCNIQAKRIWLHLDLAKKPLRCLEYVLVHEMVHLLERRHNARFRGFMDQYLPDWRLRSDELNNMRSRYLQERENP